MRSISPAVPCAPSPVYKACSAPPPPETTARPVPYDSRQAPEGRSAWATFALRGGTLAYLIRIAGKRIVLFGSMNFIESELNGLKPDIAMIGAMPERKNIADYTPRIMRALGNPPIVLPTHWDRFNVTRYLNLDRSGRSSAILHRRSEGGVARDARDRAEVFRADPNPQTQPYLGKPLFRRRPPPSFFLRYAQKIWKPVGGVRRLKRRWGRYADVSA